MSGTARLEQAAAAYDNCLSVTRSVWPPDWVENIATRQNEVSAEIKRRIAAPAARWRQSSANRFNLCDPVFRVMK